MTINLDGGKNILLNKLDEHNEIDIEISDSDWDECSYVSFNIDQAKNLIQFLQEQVDTFNNKYNAR